LKECSDRRDQEQFEGSAKTTVKHGKEFSAYRQKLEEQRKKKIEEQRRKQCELQWQQGMNRAMLEAQESIL
jgi:hypothetical protein